MNTPRTNTGDALDLVQDAEWSLLTTNLATEGEYLTYVFLNLFYLFICRDLNYIPYSFYGRYALTGLRSLEEGSHEYAKRLVFFNKKYRHDTKQALADSAQQLLRLHSNQRTGENAYQRLKSIVTTTLRTCHDLYAFFEQKQQDWAALLRRHHEPPTTRQFNNRSIAHVKSIVTEVRRDEALIRQVWDDCEACFEALCSKDHLMTMYAALRERKLAKAWFVTECTPLFARLEGLCGQRSEILKDVHGVGNRQLTIWAALMPDYVPTLQVQSQLEAHNRAEDLIRMSRELQTQVMNELSVLHSQATSTPATLPGPGGVEISVERLCQATSQYETLLGLVSKTYTIAMDAKEEIQNIQVDVVVVQV